MTSTFRLYIDQRFYSPYAMWVYITLLEKGIPFELVYIDLTRGEQRDATYQRLSLSARVPTLEHGDFALSESSAIIEYLEELYPAPAHPSVFPRDLQARARARQLQAWLRSDLTALRQERSVELIYTQPVRTPLSSAGQQAADDLIRVSNQLIPEDSGPLFGSWCIADSELALTLNRLAANGDPVPEKQQRYLTAQWARPSVQAWVAKKIPHAQ